MCRERKIDSFSLIDTSVNFVKKTFCTCNFIINISFLKEFSFLTYGIMYKHWLSYIILTSLRHGLPTYDTQATVKQSNSNFSYPFLQFLPLSLHPYTFLLSFCLLSSLFSSLSLSLLLHLLSSSFFSLYSFLPSLTRPTLLAATRLPSLSAPSSATARRQAPPG